MELVEDVGTAGGIPLILQVLIPVVAISKKQLNLKIKGCTDVLWSPTIDYTQYVLQETYSKMGINFSFKLIKRGYYPKCSGEIKLQVNSSNMKPISFSKRKIRALLVISKKEFHHSGFFVSVGIITNQNFDSHIIPIKPDPSK